MSDPRLRQALLVALAVVAVDQLTKAIVERSMALYESIPILPGFSLTYVRNTGAAFGMLAGAPSALRLPLFLVAGVALGDGGAESPLVPGLKVAVGRASGEKCERCWRTLPLGSDARHPTLCSRCAAVVA